MSLVGALAQAEDDYLPIFATNTVDLLLEYKWTRFAQNVHIVGACIHMVYIISLGYYINTVFLHRQPYDPEDAKWASLPPLIRNGGLTDDELNAKS